MENPLPPNPHFPSSDAAMFLQRAAWLLLLASVGIPASLLWDFSWESTVGIDLAWAPAHVATYLSVLLGGAVVAGLFFSKTARGFGVRVGKLHAPLGAWIVAWGTVAFGAAVLFDRWWQSSYGLAAGIWHPPQMLKASAFFAILIGGWIFAASAQNRARSSGAVAFSAASGVLLAMINVATITFAYPNRQHSAAFYQLACGLYPLMLAATASAGRLRFPATTAALIHLTVMCLLVWLLPLVPAKPQVAPIYNTLDHLMPPPFPLLLVAPALALDALLRWFPGREQRFQDWRRAGECGLAFFAIFIVVQWPFAQFLLTPAADHWFFAGGGMHWPFFLKIDPRARVAFWKMGDDEFTLARGFAAAGFAVLSTRAGLWLGAWMQRVQR